MSEMLCAKPYISAGRAYGCGQCMPCRCNRRREWQTRIMLESALWEENAFITLTYREECISRSSCGLSTLVPQDVQRWLKRVRKKRSPEPLRFYLVGEYGDVTERPHYHAILFNHPTCRNGRSMYQYGYKSCCDVCDSMLETWGLGFVDMGSVEFDSAGYVCGYVTKKMTRHDDARLYGRHPEFARMSLKPGIGFHAMHDVASQLLKFGLDSSEVDVPRGLRFGPTTKPLARYLRRGLRRMIGRDEKAPQGALAASDAKMLPLRLAAARDEKNPSLRYRVVLDGEGRRASMMARSRIFKQRRSV